MKKEEIIKGRGAQFNTANPFLKNEYGVAEIEGVDVEMEINEKTTYYFESPKKMINKVDSPDLGMVYSMNPYQGL